ncbi:MAG: Crp/Fnr family transcriptional regulator [Ruminococcus sp.]|nr:Crp/Fnr family transcriptional regulator [Ruminococcus sp.]MCM1381922.1 Crp/Fnr family transcriptional regulator [Muribaculaceae bacterium]MCM1480238.1 Crp/Fnr family transcriptional regulator [Muribaculaceae bacterium]
MKRENIAMEDIAPVLGKCMCFRDIPEERYRDVLRCLKARYARYRKGEMIRNPRDARFAGIVVGGSVKLVLHSESGGIMSIDYYNKGDMFNEDIACSERTENHSQLWAAADCAVLFLDLSVLFAEEKVTCRFKKRVALNLLRNMAEQSVRLNEKLRILAQKRLRDRIKVYLQSRSVSVGKKIAVPYNRSELAEFLGVDRSALSRELGRMQDEKIIRVESDGFTVTDENFLI